MYHLIKPLLFRLDPEFTHTLALRSLKFAYDLGFMSFPTTSENSIINYWNLSFPNRIGLAAGFDKNGDYVDQLARLGFGFIEIGTLTPKPQVGNPKPRLFRLPNQKAVINRMGVNNKGIDYAAKRLAEINYRGVLGINIGKNRETPNEHASHDYLQGMRKLWPFASYFTINISSPNTPGLRDLQNEDLLLKLLADLKHEQHLIQKEQNKFIPLIVKIAPDLNDAAIDMLADIFLHTEIDGIIATNTSVNRFNIHDKQINETGGLSGEPLQRQSLHVIKKLQATLNQRIPIISSGGIMSEQSVQDSFAVGADLIQVYTGMIYEGPGLIKRLASQSRHVQKRVLA